MDSDTEKAIKQIIGGALIQIGSLLIIEKDTDPKEDTDPKAKNPDMSYDKLSEGKTALVEEVLSQPVVEQPNPGTVPIPGEGDPEKVFPETSLSTDLDPDTMSCAEIKAALTELKVPFNRQDKTDKVRCMLILTRRGVAFEPSETPKALKKKVADSEVATAIKANMEAAQPAAAPAQVATPSAPAFAVPGGVVPPTTPAPGPAVPTAPVAPQPQAPANPATATVPSLPLLQAKLMKLGNSSTPPNWQAVTSLVQQYGQMPSGNLKDVDPQHYPVLDRAVDAALAGGLPA